MKTEAPNQDLIAVERSTFEAMQTQIEQLSAQLDWFKRQVFGVKSEKRLDIDGEQATLFAPLPPDTAKDGEDTVTVPGHKRRKQRTGDEVNDTGMRFDDKVPVREITLSCPELDGPDAQRYEIIDYKVSLRLARQPGAHVVLKYLRPVVRDKADGALQTVPAPVGVLDHAQVDVSTLAGMLVDKFVYHLPLYRQHQRLLDEGIRLSRSTIDQWVRSTIALLGPVSRAVWQLVLGGGHLKIDETPIPAGTTRVRDGPRAGQGKIKQAWIWPVMGEQGDIVFGYTEHRSLDALKGLIGQSYAGTIQTDGYNVYDRYQAKLPGCVHALCWAHTRRAFIKAEKSDPKQVEHALGMIRQLYKVEQELREQAADEHKIIAWRQTYSRPIVEAFFQWIEQQIGDPSLLPKSPLAKALNYARERQQGLSVFLSDAWLDLDTNDLERALRVIPMGKKNWMFCMTEAGAEQVSTIQTLLATCRAHDVDPYTYLVDVLQRINTHPNDRIEELTPRIWAQRFASDPLRSDLTRCQ